MLKQKEIVFVTQDAGNGNALALIAAGFSKTGCITNTFFGKGKSLGEGCLVDMENALSSADWLIVSFSSSVERSAEELFAMGTAIRLGVRIAIFSDTYGMYSRPWFQDHIRHAHLLTVVTEDEIELAKKYVGYQTRIVCTGNPSWHEFCIPVTNRNEVRSRLTIGNEKLILAIGSKENDRNMALYTDLIKATNALDVPISLILTYHPGASLEGDAYADLLKSAKYPIRFVGNESGVSTQAIIVGSDIVVTGGGSSLGIATACLRVPVIDLIHEPLDSEWWKNLSDLDFWPPNTLGASLLTKDVASLQVALSDILKGEHREVVTNMRHAQETHFSPESFQMATQRFIDTLQTI